MIEEFCKNMYNIGLKPDCSLSKNNCLCPDKYSYEYLCYQCYLKQKEKLKEDYQIKLDIESGRILIVHAFEKEVVCRSKEWGRNEIINVVVDDIEDKAKDFTGLAYESLKSYIELVALALTQSITFPDRNISYANVIDAFNTEQFENHFWNLLLVVIHCFQKGVSCNKPLEELFQCILGIKTVYEKRKSIGQQFLNYIKFIGIGLEKTGNSLPMPETFWRRQYGFIHSKTNSETIRAFLFCCIDRDGKLVEYGQQREAEQEFSNACFILKQFLLNYQHQKHAIDAKTYEDLLGELDLFIINEIDIHLMSGLEKLNLESANAWKANADLLLKYLRKRMKRNSITIFS